MQPARMTRRGLFAGAAMVPMASARAACAGFEDLMPAFWAVHDGLPPGDPVTRARALIERWFTPRIEVHRGAGVGRVDLAQWILRFDPVAAAVRRLSERLPALWCARMDRFRAVLPDAAAEVPAMALVSFFWFDGRTRLWRDRVTLFLGLDMIQALHGEDPGPLLDHERFHLYHHEVNPTLILPGGDPLWLGLWKEGLAVHATAVLNPGAARQRIFMGDAALAGIGPELLRRIAAELPARLDATDGATRARYLGFGYRGDIPARSGYALGLEVVERVSAGRDLAALARIPAAEAASLVRREVEALAG